MSQKNGLIGRRRFVTDMSSGLGAIALASVLQADGVLAADGKQPYRPRIDPASPHAPRSAPQPAKARQVLVIFCSGALSHIDTFDWKPELVRRDGQMMSDGEAAVTFQGENGAIAQPLYS